MSHLFYLALTSPCLELSYTVAATALVPQFYDPAKEKTIKTHREANFFRKTVESLGVIQRES